MGILLEVQTTVQLDDSNVIVEVARMELWVILDLQDIHFHIGVRLCVTVDIPLPQPHSQLLRSELVDAVCGRDEVTRVDQSSPTGVDIIVLILL